MTARDASRHYWEDAGLVLLLGGFLLPPFAWLLDLQFSYAAVKWACAHDRREVILLMPIGSLALIALATWMSWTCWKKLHRIAEDDGGRMEDRSYLLATGGLALNGIFALLILLSYVPRYFLGPCE